MRDLQSVNLVKVKPFEEHDLLIGNVEHALWGVLSLADALLRATYYCLGVEFWNSQKQTSEFM